MKNFISYINIFTTTRVGEMAKCGAKSSPTCRCCTPSKEGEKGSVIRICPKVPNLYIRLPLLAYITEFQILPSVYDAVKKQGYSDEDVAAHEGTECDAGTSYIHAATIGEMLLHFLGVALLHIIEE